MNEKREQISQKLDFIKAQFQMKYGMEMDEWSVVNLAESQELFDRMKKQLDASMAESKRLHDTFKGSVKPINFNSDKQSFVYGLGISLPYATCSLICGLLMFFYLRTFKHYKDISDFVTRYENSKSYINMVQTGKIETVNGEEILVLKPKGSGENIYGQVYEFDSKRKEVHVPLRRLK